MSCMRSIRKFELEEASSPLPQLEHCQWNSAVTVLTHKRVNNGQAKSGNPGSDSD